MELYSIIEIIWLWTGNHFCEYILTIINVHLYDPAVSNDWWPPLLWKNQLRSFCLEPSFFGIIVNFLIPFLWIKLLNNKSGKILYTAMLIMAVYMIFLTNARTAIIIYLGELFLFCILSGIIQFKRWKSMIICLLIVTGICFGSSIIKTAVLQNENQSLVNNSMQYVNDNIISIGDIQKRSNTARMGNTVATFKVGLENPIFGVGKGYQAPFLQHNFPDFAKNDYEVLKWTKDMKEKTFLISGYPVLNQYAAIFMWNGTLGLILFLIPIIYIFYFVIIKKQILHEPTFICISVALVGQLFCMLSNEFFYTFPISLSLVYCYIEYWKTKSTYNVIN